MNNLDQISILMDEVSERLEDLQHLLNQTTPVNNKVATDTIYKLAMYAENVGILKGRLGQMEIKP